ncbi:hypothetical protein D3C78_1250110 [compost metagenome]
MGGLLTDPEHGIGDVLRLDGLHPLIDGGRLGIVTVEAHVGELGAAAQARLQVGDADGGARQIGPQVQAELLHERLGGAVDVAARVGVGAGDGADVDHVAAIARHHARQQQAGEQGQAADVGGYHLLPVFQIRLVGGLKAERQPGVVHQQIHLAPLGRQPGDGGAGGGLVLHVERQRQELLAQLVGQGGQPLGAATGAYHPVTSLHQQTADGLTKPGRGARYHCDHLNLHCYLSG